MIQLWQHKDLGLKQFAFLNTVVDQFVNLDGDECWCSAEEFLDSWRAEGERNPYHDNLERFTSKLEAFGWTVPPVEEIPHG